MASPAELAQLLPDTLPEDFSEWDGGNSPAVPQVGDSSPEAFLSPVAQVKLPAPPAEAQIPVAPEAEPLRKDSAPSVPAVYPDPEALRAGLKAIGAALKSERIAAPLTHAQAQPVVSSRNEVAFPQVRAGSAALDAQRRDPGLLPPSAPADEEAFFNQLRAMGSVLNTQPIRASHKIMPARAAAPISTTGSLSIKPISSNSATERRRTTEPIRVTAAVEVASAPASQMFRSDLGDVEDQNPDRKKWIKVAVITVASILFMVFLGVRMWSSGAPTVPKQSAGQQQAVSDESLATGINKPSPSTQLGAGKPSAAARLLPIATGQPGVKAEDNSSPQVDSQPMNDQLTAAPRIPQDIKTKVKDEAPPTDGVSATNPEDATNASGIGVFNQQAKPTVAFVPYPRETISPSIAEGLLIQKTEPVYPKGAWYGGVTGKVVFEATVSRTGLVQSLHYVSGPQAFRQAAFEAVKSWRYKPYVIDNVPREFQTTVAVTFDQKSGLNPLSFLHSDSHAKKAAAALKSEVAGAQ